jgi:hypothetical protein
MAKDDLFALSLIAGALGFCAVTLLFMSWHLGVIAKALTVLAGVQ